ncbi:DUF4062 domain-containing protein [Rhizobium leguminosarum]|uniref:DUF4062 domain-containing protein n=1 Tax=Rhizobium leguminosarum TaxID=384 RepID=UPI003D06FE4D
MKIFISSLISGMEPIRAVAREAVEQLGHKPVMADRLRLALTFLRSHVCRGCGSLAL